MSDQFGFGFNIGDVVCLKVSALQDNMRMQILERRYQECPGGVQRHYVARPVYRGGIIGEYQQFNEVELVLSEPFQEKAKVSWVRAAKGAKNE